jgi:hypothetical protein
MLNLFLFLVVYGMGYVARIRMPDTIDPSANAYISLWSPGNWFRGATAMASINVLLTWLKIFRYIGFVPVFAQISRTLEASFRACFGFIIVFVLIGFAMASAFLLAFGTRIEVGRHADPSLKGAWFQPLRLSSEHPVSKLAFQMQLCTPLHRGVPQLDGSRVFGVYGVLGGHQPERAARGQLLARWGCTS